MGDQQKTPAKRGNRTDWQRTLRLLQMARPYWLHSAGILALGVIQAPLALLTPLPMKIAVDSVVGSRPLPGFLNTVLPGFITQSDMGRLSLAVALMVIITLLVYAASLGTWWLATYTGEKLILEFRTRLFRHVQRLSLTYHDTKGTTDSTYRIHYDTESIRMLTIGGVPLLTAGFTLIAMVVMTAWLDTRLALIALAVCPALYFITEAFKYRIRDRWSEVKKLDSSAMTLIQEVLSSVRVVKAFGREDYEHQKFVRRSDQRVQGQVEVAILNGQFDLYVGATIAVGSALVLFVGILHVKAGTLTLGSLLMVMSYLVQLYEPLKMISKKLAELQSGMVSAERAFSLLDEVPQVVERAGAIHLDRAKGAFQFKDVCFSYNPNQPVLQEICFEAPAGAKIGIQGRTGAGKSTLISMLMRFYDPVSGQVLLDGHDIRDYKLADLRNQFAMVLQEPVLFSTSIAENIAYGRPEASDAEIIEAARRANAHDFISRLPDGYETEVGERGMKLSGGERQRISLARAFLKDAPILVLDEPTSSVDVKTEAAIMDAMERLMQDRTTFIIAHRLSTLDGCDVRLEMEYGRLIPYRGGVLNDPHRSH
jgi:ATP-binding cassette subfamily B protein